MENEWGRLFRNALLGWATARPEERFSAVLTRAKTVSSFCTRLHVAPLGRSAFLHASASYAADKQDSSRARQNLWANCMCDQWRATGREPSAFVWTAAPLTLPLSRKALHWGGALENEWSRFCRNALLGKASAGPEERFFCTWRLSTSRCRLPPPTREAKEPSLCFRVSASPFPVPSPGRSVTRARRLLRKQNCKLPCKRLQTRGSAQGRALPPLRQDDERTSLSPHCNSLRILLQCGLAHRGGHPDPQTKSLHG